MEKWIEDIKMGIEMAKVSNGPSTDLLTSNLNDSSKSCFNEMSTGLIWFSVWKGFGAVWWWFTILHFTVCFDTYVYALSVSVF